jgi:HEAT repeats/PBS lyase HEAT-like repeat
MFGWFRPKCPLDLPEALAVDHYMSVLAEAFGVSRFRESVVVRANPDFFPGSYKGVEADAYRIFGQVKSWTGVDATKVVLHLAADESMPANRRSFYVAGDPQTVVIGRSCLHDPITLAAALASGLSHLLLVAHGFQSADADHEALAEGLTVVLGMGVLAANTVMQESHLRVGRSYSWRMARQGAFSEKQYGYALALFAWVRDEHKTPPWSADLRANVRSVFRQSLNYLVKTGDAQFKPTDEESGLSDAVLLARRIESLASQSRGARLAALWDLQERGARAMPALDAIVALLKAPDSPLQIQAAEVLAAIGPGAESAIPDLLETTLQDYDGPLRMAALAALGHIGRRPEPVLPVLMRLLGAAESSERILAAWALGRFGAAAGGAVVQLAEMLQEGNSSVAAEAAYSLGSIGGVATVAIPALIEALKHGEATLPVGAAYALGCMGAAAAGTAVPALRKALKHMDPTVSEEAALALRQLGFENHEAKGAGANADITKRSEVYRSDPRRRRP